MKSKLSVRNFGPIKDVNLTLSRVNIFIGEQGVGKSTIAKLIAIFKVMKGIGSRDEADFIRLLREYQLTTFIGSEESQFSFHENGFHIDFEVSESTIKRKKLLKEWTDKISWALYIPADRLFLTAYLNSLNSILRANIPIPISIRNFASYFETAKQIDASPQDLPYIDFLNVEVAIDGEKVFVTSKSKNYTVELSNAASGFQSSIPMFMIVDYYSQFLTDRMEYTFVIEEPEQSLYPLTQLKLMQSLLRCCNSNSKQKHGLTITTHSPYIISAIDDLIQAGEIANDNQNSQTIIGKLIPESSWLRFNEVAAYYLTEKGTAESILDKKGKGIKGNKMDDVTKQYERIYGKLLHLKYQNAEADVL